MRQSKIAIINRVIEREIQTRRNDQKKKYARKRRDKRESERNMSLSLKQRSLIHYTYWLHRFLARSPVHSYRLLMDGFLLKKIQVREIEKVGSKKYSFFLSLSLNAMSLTPTFQSKMILPIVINQAGEEER